jgi:hypothetical protein
MVTQLMVCKMMLNESFWRHFELDLQEIKLAYLNWAIGYAREPKPEYRHLFRWDHQDSFCLINSRYGRAFAISPFGAGVRGVSRPRYKGLPRGLDEIDMALKDRLTKNTGHIRSAIAKALESGHLNDARQAVLNFYWLKLGAHELLFDRTQLEYDDYGYLRKGRWGLDETEKWRTLNGIRNRIVNVTRYGEFLEDKYVLNLNRKLPGLSGRGTKNTFLSSALSIFKYGICSMDCGPLVYSKKGFVHFSQVKNRMNLIGWPYHGCPSQVLRPLYKIGLNYRRPPIRRRGDPDEGYSLKSLRRRACQLYEIIDNLFNEINRIRNEEIV